MKTSELPVVAVIANYNMAESLAKLIKQLLTQNYHEIIVLDDASTDNSLEAMKQFKNVRVIEGKTNVGPAANRNRILQALDYDAIIHFLDADVSLTSKDNVALARKVFSDKTVGIVGGLITLPDGKPWLFNYGPRYSLYSTIGGTLQIFVAERPKLKHLAIRYFVKEFPNINKQPSAKKVFWVGEANMLITTAIFRKVGGFDQKLRYHEAQDISIKLKRRGYTALHYPDISVEHPYIDILSKVRGNAARKAGRRLVRKYGYRLK